MRFKLNIGTEVGSNHGIQHDIPKSKIDQIVETTFEELSADTDINYSIERKLSTGGDWAPELIIVVTLNVSSEDFGPFWFTLLELVRTTGQDCIAVDGISHCNGGYLLFHPDYDSERYTFDRTFFVA